MNRKKILILFAALLLVIIGGCATVAIPQAPDELDIAIRDASDYLNDNIPRSSKIVILNIQSDSNALSEYIIEELIANAVNDRIFTVVDRAQLELIRAEQHFQWSGEVDDRTALEVGRFFGAQYIVSGAISELADRYRMRIRALNVQTAQVQGQYNRNIATGKTIIALMRSRSGTSVVSSGSRTERETTTSVTNPRQTQPVQQPIQTYRLGDTGPAGGLVFYDKGNNVGGWRYLEAAPADLGPTDYIENPGSFPPNLYQLWERTYEREGRAVGRGTYNSEYLMTIAQARGGFTWAVRLCDNYEANGFTDWFLPSRDELNFIYGNLYLQGKGNFRPEQYWSSTGWTDTWGSYRAWYINFADGKHDNTNPRQQRRVRPVRQF